MDSQSKQLIDIATRYVGVAESPTGSNRGTQIDEWNTAVGVPVGSFWCASFVSAMTRKWEAQTGYTFPLKVSASCDSWFNQAKDKGLLTRMPRPGRIMLVMSATNPNDAIHIGICGYEKDGVISSIEGNSNNDGSNNGTIVARRTNHASGRKGTNLWYIDWTKALDLKWDVVINGKTIDVLTVGDVVYVPIRQITDALDVPMTVDAVGKTIRIKNEG